ncbi:alpha/beta fold hydrolase [Ornithinimicrobium cerasi]|uniref:alpha/beta fold hydrolase n=1 Tax=Ornithinimicrobium cerasi TaxID=2248773 RepID=UPI000EFF7C76|nr:alpha/beta hydrolase [Ornithinimicrobium cerasi]
MTRPGAPRTQFVDGPAGPLEILRTGSGDPSTLLVHGLAGSISTTRPYATGVPGRRTFVHLRCHGRSVTPPGGFGYADLAAEVWSVADHQDVRADRALGVSMGAGAIVNGLTRDPDRFERVVLVVPASLDRVRSDAATQALGTLAARLEAGDLEAVTDHLVAGQPESTRADPAVRTWARGQAEQLLASGVARALRVVPEQVPVPDRSLLARVTCPVLVLAQEGDPTHPVAVAEELAGLLPRATLRVSGPGGIMWADRSATRDVVGSFLAGR